MKSVYSLCPLAGFSNADATHMEQVGKNIASALVKAQRNFAPALKTSTNPHFRSKYADLAACVEAVLDALNEQNIALVQPTYESDSGVIVETVFIHESGETISSGRISVPAAKHDAQGFGSALTYARRYSLMAACGIAPEDDDGNASVKASTKPLSEEQIEEIKMLADAVDTPISAIEGFYKKQLTQIPAGEYGKIVNNLKKKMEASK